MWTPSLPTYFCRPYVRLPVIRVSSGFLGCSSCAQLHQLGYASRQDEGLTVQLNVRLDPAVPGRDNRFRQRVGAESQHKAVVCIIYVENSFSVGID